MDFTQTALAMLVLFWGLQVAGSWIQWKHYRQSLSDASSRWADGFLGAGQAKRRFAPGAIAILEVDPDLRVRRLQTMSGFSVFTRFQPLPFVQNWTLAQLGAHYAPGPGDNARSLAIRQAIARVEEVRKQKS